MSAEHSHVPLNGTTPVKPMGAVEVREARPAGDTIFEIDVLVQPRHDARTLARDVAAMADRLPLERRYLGHAEFAERHGADPEKLERLRAFADQMGLEITRVDPETRLVVIKATAAAFERAFRMEFTALRWGAKLHRSFNGLVHVPAQLKDVVEGVFGLDDVPRFDRTSSPMDAPAAGAADAAVHGIPADEGYVERFYQFPESTSGKGQTVAIIMLGGGYFPEDIDARFSAPGIRRPSVRCVEVGGAKNAPVDRNVMRAYLELMGFAPKDSTTPAVDRQTLVELIKPIWWTIEAALDIQLVGSFANGADIVVYFAPPTERGKINALATALGSGEHTPSVISCSWGAPEDAVHGAALDSVDRLLQSAALKGVTVCYSSGDSGADLRDEKPYVHFPASSPHVLSCGGTILDTQQRRAELVWQEKMPVLGFPMASGGGFSRWFAKPAWQTAALAEFQDGIEHRGVPDVAGKADLANGYEIVVAGHRIAMGGTSAAAPMWAALVARLNEALGHPVGWLTPLVYRDAFRRVLQPISEGSDGYYPAGPGWDPCTGCGTPRGRGLLEALRGH